MIIFSGAGEVTGGGPDDIPDIEWWMDASQETGFSNGDEMSTVQDWSGNARHGTGEINNVKKPTYRATDGPNSLPAIRFQNNATFEGGNFLLPNFLTAFTVGHAFAVVKLDIEPGITSRAGPIFGDWGTGAGEVYPSVADNIIRNSFGSNATKTTGDPAALTNWHVYEVRSGSGHWSDYHNRTQLFTTATNTVAWGTAPRLGQRRQIGTSTLYGMMAEVLFYSRILDTDEVDTIYEAWNDKYGFAL
jgi:hypothetical protein